jgi:hypothetical protein
MLHFSPDSRAVGVFTKPHGRRDDQIFEFAKHDMAHIVILIRDSRQAPKLLLAVRGIRRLRNTSVEPCCVNRIICRRLAMRPQTGAEARVDAEPTFPISNSPYSPAPTKEPLIKVKFHWKWTLWFLLALVAWGMWTCGSAFMGGARLAENAVQQFHQQLNAADYRSICKSAAEGFCNGQANDRAVRFLKGVHQKLGAAGAGTRSNLNVNSSTNGTFVSVEYSTTFAAGLATESFTWIKRGGKLQLYRYNVQSDALILE